MKIIAYYIVSAIICICLLSGCRGRQNGLEDPVKGAGSLFIVYDVESALLHPTDSFTLNDIASSVRLIRLKTPADVFVSTFRFQAVPFGEGFAVSSAAGNSPVESVLLFDENGQYLKPALIRGHGHGELPRIWNWSVCMDTLYALGDKTMLQYSADGRIGQIAKEPDMITDVVPLKSRWLVYLPPWTLMSEHSTSLDLKFLDRLKGTVQTRPMPLPATSQEKLLDYPGLDKGNMERAILSATHDGMLLFKNIYNDTLYRIASPGEVYPEAVFHTGRFRSRPQYAEDRHKKEKTVMIDVISETDHYLIVRCLFHGEKHLTIWDKRSGKNVASLPMRYKGSFAEQCYISPIWYRTPSGKRVVVNLLGFGKGRLLAGLMPEHASEIFPASVGDRDFRDENPVLLEVCLK